MVLTSVSATRARLQEDLRSGLNCMKDIWQYEAKDWITCIYAADIDQDRDIEVLAGSHTGRVYALDKDGHIKWEHFVEDKPWVTTVVACAPSEEAQGACVIVGTRDGKIYVLDQFGNTLLPPDAKTTGQMYWYNAGRSITHMWLDMTFPLTIVFAAEDLYVHSFDLATFHLNWRFHTNNRIGALFTCDINSDGRAETLIGTADQTLYLLSPIGKLIASCRMEQAILSLFAADIDQDGICEILVGTRTKKLFVLTPQLNEKWQQTLSSRPLAIEVIDVNSDNRPEILVTCDDQSLSLLDNSSRVIWRQHLGKRFHSLNTSDLNRDGYTELLAGTDDSRVYAIRIQLVKDLDKKIRRDYAALGKPEIPSLPDLASEQISLLQALLDTSGGTIDKYLSLTSARALIEAGNYTNGLLAVLKLEQQHFQLQWERGKMGYRRALCLPTLAGEKGHEIAVSARNGGFSIFNASGRLLWSQKPPLDDEIFDAQSGYLSTEQSEDLAFASFSGSLSLMSSSRSRSVTTLQLPEPINCFYILAPGRQYASDILVGCNSGKAYLYTDNVDQPAHIFEMPAPLQRVYASEPDENGKYHSPELLIGTEDNTLFAYTRGGNQLWTYSTRTRIMALCVKDLDKDGRMEVLIGSEDRNIYVLDDTGHLRWRYVLFHSVLALETADLDGDGQQEILAGCRDGILYVFTSNGDLIWRYQSRDPIQALRAADIDHDGNFEIVMVEEGHLEVLQVVRQQDLDELKKICWDHLHSQHDPLPDLLPLIKDQNPLLRAAALLRLAELRPLPPEAFDLFHDALSDPLIRVRKVLPEALMRAFPADPARARRMLDLLFTEPARDVRIEVVEHLELLALYDWNGVLSFLDRALRSSERTTRRAALRKISRLLSLFKDQIQATQHTLGEALFKLLIKGGQSGQNASSIWVQQEAGRVLANFINLFEDDFLLYLLRMFSNRIEYEALDHATHNFSSARLRDIATYLLTLKSATKPAEVATPLALVARSLENLAKSSQDLLKSSRYGYSTDLWLVYRELDILFRHSTIEALATYKFSLKPEQFQTMEVPYPHSQAFLHLGENLAAITQPLKTYLSRNDPNDRLDSLLESIDALTAFQRLVDREYSVSPLPNEPLPYLPEFLVFKALIAQWQDLFHAQRNELRGHPDLRCDLQRRIHLEETVGIWLQVANHGRAPARQVKITLLSDKSFTTEQPAQLQVFEAEVLAANQDISAEFILKPLSDSVTLTFEIIYTDTEHEKHTEHYQERLDFIEHPRTFTQIPNPYTTGTPLHDGHMCYGREAPLAYLYDNLTRTTQTVLVLHGQRRSGKTTLLNQLAETDLLLPHVAVMIDMQNLVYNLKLGKFFFQVAYKICRTLRKRGLHAPTPSRPEFDDTSPTADPLFAFELFLDTIEDLLGERQLILLLDEFEELENLVKKGSLKPEIFPYLRSLMQERPYIHFLLSGTQRIQQLTSSYWSVFFNIALHHRLSSNISAEGATDLITQPVAGALDYEPQVVNKIRGITADQPYVIHLVCRALVDHCNKMQKNYATLHDVNLVQKEVLLSGSNHFGWLWERFGGEERLLLQVIAEGSKDEGRPLDLDEIKRIFTQFGYPFDVDKVKASLKILWAEDVIEVKSQEAQVQVSDTARYTLVNGLLRQWMKDDRPLQKHKPDDELAPAEQPVQQISAQQEQALPADPVQEVFEIQEPIYLPQPRYNGSHEPVPQPSYSPEL